MNGYTVECREPDGALTPTDPLTTIRYRERTMAANNSTRLVKCPSCKQEAEGYVSKNIRYCKTCWRQYSKRYRLAHKPQFAATMRKYRASHKNTISRVNRQSRARHGERYNLNRKLGGSSLYAELLASQNGLCAICAQPERSRRYKTLSVDHCHASGAIRGLLCSHCNRALGLFKDSVDVLMGAVRYLKKDKP